MIPLKDSDKLSTKKKCMFYRPFPTKRKTSTFLLSNSSRLIRRRDANEFLSKATEYFIDEGLLGVQSPYFGAQQIHVLRSTVGEKD